jgi:P27 family predicted phage terminase small subunit
MPRLKKDLRKHLLEGTQPQWAAGDEQPNFAAARPKMPKYLPPVAAKEWKRLVNELSQRGTLTRCDSSALEIYVTTFARWKQAVAEVEKRGPVIESTWTDQHGTEHSKLVENPASKIAARLENSLRQMLKEFSATPASRDRTKPAAAEPKQTECPWPEGSVGWYEWHKDKQAPQHQAAEISPKPAIEPSQVDFEV